MARTTCDMPAVDGCASEISDGGIRFQNLLPVTPDDFQTPLDGPPGKLQPFSDFLVSAALKFQSGDFTQVRVVQSVDQVIACLGEARGELGRRLARDEAVNDTSRGRPTGDQKHRLSYRLSDVAFFLVVVAVPVMDFPQRDGQQQSPESVAVAQIGKPTGGHAVTETDKGALCGIVLVVDPTRVGMELSTCDLMEAIKEVSP